MADINNKLRVALIRGPIVFKNSAINNEATPGLGYAYICGYLRQKGYEPVLVDAIAEGLDKSWPLEKYPGYKCKGLTFDEIIGRIPRDSKVIGFSGMFSGEWPVLRSLISETRKHFPEALFVAGGEHITALTEYSLRDCPALNVCVRGEGEQVFYELLEDYANTGGFSDVKSVSYLDENGCYRQNGKVPSRIDNINKIPWPYWPKGYLETFWAAGKSFGIATKRDMPIMVSRGCPYQCRFCSSSQMWTTDYKLRDVNDVMDEIRYYIKTYSISCLQFYDLTAIVQKKWIVEFCRRLIDESIALQWTLPSGTRCEALDAETLGLLKKTGCSYLVYAPESGSQKVLEMVNKKILLGRITSSILEAKRQGLTLRANLIIGFPKETWKDIFKTIAYGLKLAIRGVDEVPIFIFSPYPGTEIFEELKASGRISLGDDYFFNLTSLNSSYLSPRVVSYNPHISAAMIGLIRMIFISVNFSIGYLLYPSRIVRTLRNLFSNKEAATVFEHRLNDLFGRSAS